MMQKFLFFLLFVCNLSLPAYSQQYDAYNLRSSLEDFVRAWNTHDPKSLLAFWSDDGDLINSWGKWGKGKNNIERILAEMLHGEYSKAMMEQTVDSLRFLTPEIAFVDTTATLSNSDYSKSEKPFLIELHIIYLMQKKESGWKIISVRSSALHSHLMKVK